ncbi:MAG TPA: hypothetical protein VNA89_03790 [Gemmatimonadaceae bacterium]|nr:hypothetical protein [Gemmatimonadaceae bacterium]
MSKERPSAIESALARRLALAGLLFTLGCADFPSSVDPAFGLPDVAIAEPSYAADVQPMFTKRCAGGGCHSFATRQANLVLTSRESYDYLVNVQAAVVPGRIRVIPSDAANSWLVTMIGPDDAARAGHPRMPLAAPPLTPNQIATIVNWINRGAERN